MGACRMSWAYECIAVLLMISLAQERQTAIAGAAIACATLALVHEHRNRHIG